MLTGSKVLSVMNIVIPIYACIGMGFVSSKMGILPFQQYHLGISGFDSLFAVPFLVFRMVANNNPYAMNMKLVQVDVLSKLLSLFVLCLSYFYRSNYHQVAWISSYFNFLTMPNSILIGTPLLYALYPDVAANISTLIFLQCMLWFNICIFILEVYKATYESSEDFERAQKQAKLEMGKAILGERAADVLNEMLVENVDSLSEQDPSNDLLGSHIPMQVATASLASSSSTPATSSNAPSPTKEDAGRAITTLFIGSMDLLSLKDMEKVRAVRQITRTVLRKFLFSPVAWGSVLGLLYSLLAFSKIMHGQAMPTMLSNFVNMVANCTLGLSMFMLGMHAGASRKIFACGFQLALVGAAVRFIASPAVCALFSYAVGLRGDIFRFAVVQAMVPQATLSFVWATQYNVHADVFNTAVWFQTMTFLPFVLAADALLQVGR